MIISRNWLGQYIPLNLDDADLNRALTFSGIEVEAVKEITKLPPEVVSCRILEAEHLAGSEHLKICLVDTGNGEEPRQVVCGAPNCEKGMIAVLALPGAVLGEITIKSAKLRGVESHGMLCSERELGLSDDHAGIIRLDEGTPLGISANELYGLPDTLFELEITPNRPDLLGYLGIARDLSANLGLSLDYPEPGHITGRQDNKLTLKLRIDEPELCPRYTARVIDGVKITDSPLWLKSALIKSGLRPINNVVDITNYVMLETGHPLHAFDYQKLAKEKPEQASPSIIVRRAHEQEGFLALDGKTYALGSENLVIADGHDTSALAGVMGGKDTAISEQTHTIVLESAAFNPGSVRRTSYTLKISSDSSYRFERHQSPEMAVLASFRATELISQVIGAQPVGELIDAYPKPVSRWMLGVRPSRFELLIGYKMSEEKIKSYLEKLGLEYFSHGAWEDSIITDPKQIPQPEEGEPAMWFAIPPFRVDLMREADLLEELSRLDGYENVPVKTPPSVIMDRHAYKIKNIVAEYLIGLGFFETLSYSFNDPSQLQILGIDPNQGTQKLLNPQSSNQALMRVSLLPQLLEHIRYNLHHGERNLKLMELSRIYPEGVKKEPYRCTALLTGNMNPAHWQDTGHPIGFFDVKGIIQGLFELLDLQADKIDSCPQPWLQKTQNLGWYSEEKPVAIIGSIDPVKADKFEIDLSLINQELWMLDIDLQAIIELSRNKQSKFRELPRFPSVQRDLSFLVAADITWPQIQSIVQGVDRELIAKAEVFDEYRKQPVPAGFRSLSIRLLLQDKEKTLTDKRIDSLIDSVVKTLTQQCKIQMR